MVAGEAIKDVEPMYGAYYLPRKVSFKEIILWGVS
jgi:hypothetical protein